MKIITPCLLALAAALAFGCGAAPVDGTDEPAVASETAALDSAALQKKHLGNVKAPAPTPVADEAATAAPESTPGTQSYIPICRTRCDQNYTACIGMAGSSFDYCECYNAKAYCYRGCGVYPAPIPRTC